MRLSEKLGAICAAAALIPLIIASLIVLPQISAYSRHQAIENLQGDARAAAGLFDKRLVELRGAAQKLADDIFNRALVGGEQPGGNAPPAWARLQDMLPRAQNDYGLDFVIIADAQGHIIARHNDRPAPGETLLGAEGKNPIAEKVIAGGSQPIASAIVERGERLAQLGLDHRAQVQLAGGSTVDEAMMLEAAAPIMSSGRFIGVALIGQMLNNDSRSRPGASSLQNSLVAEMRQTLYRNTDEDAGALIAVGPAIVASSIPVGTSGVDAPLVGLTRNSPPGEDRIRQGERSYTIAWQPIKALDNTEIGAIGIARSAADLDAQKGAVRATLIVLALIMFALAGLGGFFYGRALAIRLDDLTQAANRWSVGELSTPAKDRDPMMSKWVPSFIARDEVSRLAAQLEQMRESFRQAIERLRKR
jgi:HAMP domain-containing protein